LLEVEQKLADAKKPKKSALPIPVPEAVIGERS